MATAVPCAAQDPIALARTGTAAIDAGRFGDALNAFTKAAGMRPGDASLCFGAGVAAFMLGKDDEAQARFECALARDPTAVAAAEWLGDLHYRAGRLREAIAVVETASRRTFGRPDLQQRLDGWRKQLDGWRKQYDVQSRFHALRTDHFSVFFDPTADEFLTRTIVERLEAAYSRIGGTLGAFPSRRVPVMLYTREQFDQITKLPGWSVAAYDGCIRLPLAGAIERLDELDRVLSHEFAHALVGTIGGRAVPAWLNEGLATVLEPAGTGDAEAILAATDARLTPSMLHAGFVRLTRRDAEIAYGSAARAVRRLIERRGVAAVVALLEDLARGTPFDRAFRDRMAMRYQDFSTLVAP